MATPLDRIKILEPRHPNRSTGIITAHQRDTELE